MNAKCRSWKIIVRNVMIQQEVVVSLDSGIIMEISNIFNILFLD